MSVIILVMFSGWMMMRQMAGNGSNEQTQNPQQQVIQRALEALNEETLDQDELISILTKPKQEIDKPE